MCRPARSAWKRAWRTAARSRWTMRAGWRRAEDARRTVVLAGEGNLFLEAALALRADIDVVRASVEEAPAIEGAQLYIFDGVLPQTLPQSGSLLCVNPPEGAGILGISVAGAQTPQGAVHAGDRFSENLSLAGVALRAYRRYPAGKRFCCAGTTRLPPGQRAARSARP